MAFSLIISNLCGKPVRALACAGLICVAFLPAAALDGQATVPGSEASEMRLAIEQWLDDDEEIALTSMASLARDGNPAARLMLALIDKSPPLQGPWLAHLPREERINLLRQPGGLSGRSWLHALTDQPIGAAWLSLMDPVTGPEVVMTLQELGEIRAAREAMVMLVAREHPDLRTLDPALVDPEVVYLLWRGADEDRRATLAPFLPEGSMQNALISGAVDPARLPDWLAESVTGAPLEAICSEFCAETRDSCLSGAYLALASHNALLTLGSPVEALIPQDRFLAHPRGRGSVLRRILQTHDARGRRALISQMREHDACLADILETEAARYRYRRPGSDASNGD